MCAAPTVWVPGSDPQAHAYTWLGTGGHRRALRTTEGLHVVSLAARSRSVPVWQMLGEVARDDQGCLYLGVSIHTDNDLLRTDQLLLEEATEPHLPRARCSYRLTGDRTVPVYLTGTLMTIGSIRSLWSAAHGTPAAWTDEAVVPPPNTMALLSKSGLMCPVFTRALRPSEASALVDPGLWART